MQSFISKAHGAIMATQAVREEIARNLSQVELYSHTLEDQIVSIREEICCLCHDFEEYWEQVG